MKKKAIIIIAAVAAIAVAASAALYFIRPVILIGGATSEAERTSGTSRVGNIFNEKAIAKESGIVYN